MSNEEKLKSLQRRYEIYQSEQVKEVRKEFLNYIVKASTGTVNPEKIQGMLILIAFLDSWQSDFIREMEKIRKE